MSRQPRFAPAVASQLREGTAIEVEPSSGLCPPDACDRSLPFLPVCAKGTESLCAARSPMKASDLLVKALEHEGVRYVFGLPGEENLDVLESLRASSIQL